MDAGFVLKPPVDAITEFRILTHGSNAEFGHSTGSTTNIITRSGSNQIHGALWEFLRNDIFDATNFFAFDGKVEPLTQNQFGASVGGPIRKDKTFFFGYYEGFCNRQGKTQGSTVPSLAERGGDFSAMCPPPPDGPGFDPVTGLCNNFHPETGDLGGQLLNLFTFTPYPFNQFPDTSDFSRNLLNLFPEPNTGTNTFTSTVIQRDDDNQFGIRLDHYLSSKDNLNFRYCLTMAPGSTHSPLPEPACPVFRSGKRSAHRTS